MSFLRHFADQSVFGGLLVLTLVTGIVLLVRQIVRKDEPGETTKVEAKIDVDTIEGAMKRVLASQGGPVAASPAPVVIDGNDNEAMTAALREREARIAELQTEIAKLRADLDNVQSLSGLQTAGGGAEVDTAKVAELEGKIEDLKARLQEYEIIEDDIADLSLYKDENARLKHEIKRLREEAPEAAAAVPTADEEFAKVQAEQPPPTPLPEPTAEPIGDPAAELLASQPEGENAEDDVMKQFASAVSVQKAPPPIADFKVEANPFEAAAAPAAPEADDAPSADSPLAFELDPEKIMSEVSSLSEDASSGSALEETLDTDKLLAEVGSLDPSSVVAAAPAAAPAAPAAPAVTPQSVAAAAGIEAPPPDVPAVDDLLAEFKETKS